jgi:hypothetical protein
MRRRNSSARQPAHGEGLTLSSQESRSPTHEL